MKKFLFLILALVMVLGISNEVFAEENIIEKKVFDLAEKYGCETFDMDVKSVDKIIKFDNVEELEKFIRDIEKTKRFQTYIDLHQNTKYEFSDDNKFEVTPLSRTINDNYVISKWTPFSGWGMTGLACWSNISFNYSYKYVNGSPRFINVENIDSYLTGINVTFWQQKASSYNIVTQNTTDDKVEINVKGNYVLGVALEGFNIGLTIPSEWDGSLILQ